MKKKYLPSEWHEQQAVLLTWPHKDTDWAPYLNDIIDMEVEIARQRHTFDGLQHFPCTD